MNREHYKDINYKPFLFYVVFGVPGEKLEVSQSRHHVDAFPEGLELRALSPCRLHRRALRPRPLNSPRYSLSSFE